MKKLDFENSFGVLQNWFYFLKNFYGFMDGATNVTL